MIRLMINTKDLTVMLNGMKLDLISTSVNKYHNNKKLSLEYN